MEINGFTFYMDNFDSLVTNHSLIVYDKETNRTVTTILVTKIRSLIIDNEVIFLLGVCIGIWLMVFAEWYGNRKG